MISSHSKKKDHAIGLTSADVLLLVTATLWGVNFSIVKFALSGIPPLAFNSIRFAVATVTMLLVAKSLGKEIKVRRRDLPYLIGLGLIGNTAYQILFIFGIAHTTAENSSLILATSPALVALMGSAAGVEKVSSKGWFGIGLSLAGILLIISGSDRAAQVHLGGPSLKGDLLILAGTICWSCYTLLVRPLTRRYPSTTVTTVSTAAGTIPLALIATPTLVTLEWREVPSSAWLALVFSGIFSIALSYFFWNHGVTKLGSTRTSIYSNLCIPVALFTAWMWLGESLTTTQWWGTVLAIGGVMLARRFTRSSSS
ncbi:MAG: EamA family transporter [Acidobacteriota bacterium]|nr:MAG: EamA family transporter [Acidobacteriota bacterium]